MTLKPTYRIIIFLLWCHGSSPYSVATPNSKIFTLEELVPLRPEFYPDRLNAQWVSETEYIYKLPGTGILKYDATTEQSVPRIDESELMSLYNYTVNDFSSDGRYALLASNRKKVYRYSSLADYSIYNIENKSIQLLSENPMQVVIWSQEGRALAFVQDNNVFYIADAANPEILKLTNEGVPGEVYFGAADWIYEEEIFNAAEALWFSPKTTYLAVAIFNDTNVESAVYNYYGNPNDYNSQYPELVRFKYPKAGRDNPLVGLRVYNLKDPLLEAKIIPAPVDVVGIDYILGRVNWASDQNLIVLWLNRRQSISILVNCNLQEDKCSIVREQSEHNGWIDIHEPIFDKDGENMVEIQPVFFNDQRYLHVTRFNFNTLETSDLSPGNSTVTDVVGWNYDSGRVYYILAPAELPWQRQLWVTDNGTTRCVSCKESACHNVKATFAPGAKYAVVTCSASYVVPQILLYNTETDTFKLITDNARLDDKLKQYRLPMTLFNKLTLADDVGAHIKLLLPPNIEKDKKYPMVLRVYAGPGTTRVNDNFDLEYYNSYLATNRSFIVASIDVRGTIAMGVEAMHAVNNALGTVEISDTLAAIRQLVKLYPFIDPEKIGVWGWSYGGFASTMMLIQDVNKTITCSAAVAPVTSWLYYDSIYTERYMDTPQANPFGYQRADLMASAVRIRGRKYLLVHGTGDDNVHYQNSLQLAKALQHADIPFEQMSYTDENHSLLGVSRHFYHTLDRFWTDCFY